MTVRYRSPYFSKVNNREYVNTTRFTQRGESITNFNSDALYTSSFVTTSSQYNLFSFWIKCFEPSPAGAVFVYSPSSVNTLFSLVVNADSTLTVNKLVTGIGFNESYGATSAPIGNILGWRHFLVRLDAAPSDPKRYDITIYIDDQQAFNGSTIWTEPTHSLTTFTAISELSLFASADLSAGTQKSEVNAEVAEMYMHDVDLDITQEANRRKFITSAGRPVDLGVDGSTPTGSQPLIYLKNDYTTIGTNSGSAGNFTVINNPSKGESAP